MLSHECKSHNSRRLLLHLLNVILKSLVFNSLKKKAKDSCTFEQHCHLSKPFIILFILSSVHMLWPLFHCVFLSSPKHSRRFLQGISLGEPLKCFLCAPVLTCMITSSLTRTPSTPHACSNCIKFCSTNVYAEHHLPKI